MTLSQEIRALLKLHPRSKSEKELPSGGWGHWIRRAVSLGLLSEEEGRRFDFVPERTLERLESEENES